MPNEIDPHDQLFEMLVQQDEVTWQTIILDLVKTEQLDPWNIDISLLSRRFLETIKKMQRMNFFISGKVILASALLLKMKSDILLNEHIAHLDNQLFPPEEQLLEEPQQEFVKPDIPPLLVKTPQQRKRQLTLQDLMDALKEALDVEERRKIRILSDPVIREAQLPEKKIDITELIKKVYDKVISWFGSKTSLTFEELVGSNEKSEKIMTFIPLLYLDAQQKINLMQDQPFGKINIELLRKE